MTTLFPGGIPALPYLQIDATGVPSIHAVRCGICSAVLIGAPSACAACGGRQLEETTLSDRGRLYTWTIVHRSFPGIATPFIAAVIELEGGGALKGTLFDVVPEPAVLAFDMPVRLIFRDSGQRDARGRPFISYGFIPGGDQP